MGLKHSDPLPFGIDLQTGYSKIRHWYQTNIDMIPLGGYGAQSRELISALKSTDQISAKEIRIVLWEVIAGLLEWGYHASDGSYKMGAYAHVAIRSSETPKCFGKEDMR